jgi:hypothetical protein
MVESNRYEVKSIIGYIFCIVIHIFKWEFIYLKIIKINNELSDVFAKWYGFSTQSRIIDVMYSSGLNFLILNVDYYYFRQFLK